MENTASVLDWSECHEFCMEDPDCASFEAKDYSGGFATNFICFTYAAGCEKITENTSHFMVSDCTSSMVGGQVAQVSNQSPQVSNQVAQVSNQVAQISNQVAQVSNQ